MINAYISRPSVQGWHPGVIVTAEAFGLNDHIKDLARRLADRKYVATAPDLYTREGAPDENNMGEVIQKMFAAPDSQVLGHLDAAAVDSAGGFIIQDDHTPQRPVSPIDMVANLSCPLMATFGEDYPNPSPAHADRLNEELD